jgi:hypothetical protein
MIIGLQVPAAQLVSLGEVSENIPETEKPYLVLPVFDIETEKLQEGSSLTAYGAPSPGMLSGRAPQPSIEK